MRTNVFWLRGDSIPESCLSLAALQTVGRVFELTIAVGGVNGFRLADPYFKGNHYATGIELNTDQVRDILTVIKSRTNFEKDRRYDLLVSAGLV